MNEHTLLEETIRRLKSRFYPFLLNRGAVRLYTVAKFMKNYEPAHVITISDEWYSIDGLLLHGNLDVSVKKEIAYSALEQVYGSLVKTADKSLVVPHEARYTLLTTKSSKVVLPCCRIPTTAWVLESEELKKNPQVNIMLCFFRQRFRRFAFLAKLKSVPPTLEYQAYLPEFTPRRSILFAPAEGSGWYPFLESGVSRNFFTDPKPKNASLLGDLCFLAQSSSEWKVRRKISLANFAQNFPTVALRTKILRLAQWLKDTIGFRTFIKNAYVQLLLQDRNTPGEFFWRFLLEFAEQESTKTGN